MTNVHIQVPSPDVRGYDVVVAAGALQRLGTLVAAAAPAHRYALISDRTVAGHWLATAMQSMDTQGLATETFLIDPGEANKTRASWADLTDQMLARGLGRDTAIIALGGGVVGDLAGFLAATYMRGVPVVQVPTTLLAMIDASIGGKTGVDAPAGKNLIGAFHQPRAVIADPETLTTLPAVHLSGGLAEAIKHGAIADRGYFEWVVETAPALLEMDVQALTTLVLGSVRIKGGFVTLDPFETGPRAALNFGHTLGHAIEQASGYALHHGQAVALGMVGEAALGEALGVTAAGTRGALENALHRTRLPVRLPALDATQVVSLTHSDKKARSGRTRYTLLAEIGHVARPGDGEWTLPVDDHSVMQAWPTLL